MTQHISVDLESLAKTSAARILAIGAVKFNPYTGEQGDTFYRVVDIEAPGGGDIDPSTVVWWMSQSDEARAAIFAKGIERVPLQQALVEFAEFIGFSDELPEDQEFPDVYLWERGDKDMQWLTSAYEGTGLKTPYNYNQYGCQRTLAKWVAHAEPARENVAHHALDDAIYQAEAVIQVFRSLRSAGLYTPTQV